MKNKIQLGFFLCFLSVSLFSQENSIDFDGTNDKVNCGNNASVQITGNRITLEAWVRPRSFKPNVWEGCVINKEGATTAGYMLRIGATGQVNFNIGTGAWNEINSPNNAVSLNTWHHIAGTYDGSIMRLYVDGIQVGTRALSSNIANASNNLTIGDWSSGGRGFQGRIDEVKIWNIARSATEVVSDMNTRVK